MLAKLCCLSTDSCKGQCFGLSRNQNIKLTYIIIFILLMIGSFIKNDLNKESAATDEIIQEYHCTEIEEDYQADCVAQKKTTLDFVGLATFHFILFLCLLPKTKHVKVINEGLWIIKLIVLIGIVFLISYTFGPSVSESLEFVYTLLSPLLYIITNIVLIDNIYFVDFKINSLSQKHKQVHVLKVVLSVAAWILAIVLNFMSYYDNQLWVSVSCSIFIGLFLLLTFLKISRNNSLFVYALVALHVTLVSYSVHSQQADHNKDRSIFTIQHGYRILALILTLFGMLAEGGNQIRTKKSTINQILALNTSKKQEDNRYVSSNKWIIYHLIVALIAITFPAVFCYEYHATNEGTRELLDIGRITWWVSAVLLYLWSIIVPKIYPEQDFSELENYFKDFQLN